MGKLDYSTLSDEQLEAIASGKSSAQEFSPPDMSGLSDENLEAIAQGQTSLANLIPERVEPKKPMTNPADDIESPLMRGFVKAGQFVDKYTGAPTRKAISEAQDGRSPISGFTSQFGKDPWTAPTGQDIARKAGVSDEPLIPDRFRNDPSMNPLLGSKLDSGAAPWTRSGTVGGAIDVAADPLIIGAPMVKAGQIAAKGAGQVLKGATKLGAGIAKETVIGEKAVNAVSTAADVAANSAKSTADAIKKVFSPSTAADFKEMADVAARNGIDPKLLPEAVEFGPDSIISRLARGKAEGPLGEQQLTRFHEGLAQVQEATDRKINKISGGYVPNEVEAGQLIRQGYDDSVNRLFERADVTHSYVIKAAPGLLVDGKQMQAIQSKLSGIEKFARGRALRGITNTQREQAMQLLKAVEAAKRGNGSYKQLYEAMSDIGEVAFKSKNVLADIPADTEKMQDLYFTIRDSLVKTVGKRLGPDIESKLLNSNKEISEFLKDKSVVSGVLGNKNLAPESVFKALVQGGDTRKIEAMRKILSPEQFQQMKGAVLESLVKRNSDGSFTFKSLHNALRNKRTTLEAMFEPQELVEIGELIRLGDRFGQPVLSTSGTGGSNWIRDLGQGVQQSIANDSVIDLLKAKARKPSITELPKAKPLPTTVRGASKGAQVLSVEKESAMQRRVKEK